MRTVTIPVTARETGYIEQQQRIQAAERKVIAIAERMMEWTFPKGKVSQPYGSIDMEMRDAVEELKAAREK